MTRGFEAIYLKSPTKNVVSSYEGDLEKRGHKRTTINSLWETFEQ